MHAFNSIKIICHHKKRRASKGLLFDVESGLANLNKIVSGSGSIPDDKSTYDAITRTTAFNVISSIEKKQSRNLSVQMGNLLPKRNGNGGNAKKDNWFPLCFVSTAKAGWPEVPLGSIVDEKLVPKWLKSI